MAAEDEDLALERATLRLVNSVAYMSGSRAHSRNVKAATGIDLPPSDLRVLELLANREAVPTSRIGKDLRLDLAQASRQATQLEAVGHVVRRPDPQDRRRTLVELSAETAALMDRWLLTWTRDYLAPASHWRREEIIELAAWFDLVHTRLAESLPDRPRSSAAARWAELVGDQYDDAPERFIRSVISLVTWVSQSGGFSDLLELVDSPIRQHAFFTLRLVERNGPLSIAEVAERLAIDPSQASKRLSQLTDLRLVDKAVDGFDRRSSLIRIARKGSVLLRKVDEIQLEGFHELVTDVDDVRRARWTPLVEEYVGRLLGGGVGADGVIRAGVVQGVSR